RTNTARTRANLDVRSTAAVMCALILISFASAEWRPNRNSLSYQHGRKLCRARYESADSNRPRRVLSSRRSIQRNHECENCCGRAHLKGLVLVSVASVVAWSAAAGLGLRG